MKNSLRILILSAAFGFAAPAAVFAQHSGGMAHPGAEHHTHGSHFGNAEKWAKTFDDPKRDAWQKPHEILMALDPKPGDMVADLGAGTGYLAVRLARHVPKGKVYAVDISKDMVAHLAKRAKENGIANLAAIQGSETSANLPEKIDLAVLLDVYHHIGDRKAYFGKLKSSLKPGARIAIIDFRPEAKYGAPKHMRLPVAVVDTEMAAAGYRRTASHDFLPRQYFLIYQAK
ncbi:MAG: class I SAM-dependent methyltransferase [Beijerinckiaceae bacterium]